MKVYKFHSKSCGPCKVVEKNLKEVGLKYTSIDIMDESEYTSPEGDYDLLEQFNVRNVPTLIITDDENKVVDRFVGVLPVNAIKHLVEKWNLECV